MSKIDRTVVQNANLQMFVSDVVQLAKDGWDLDQENPPVQLAWIYEAQLLRPARETDPEKLAARARILEKARAAKAAKAGTVGVEETSPDSDNEVGVEPQ